MNILKKTLSVITISIILIACGNDGTKKGDFLPPVKVEIPAELAGNEDAVALIESSEKAINEFSNNIETLIVENEDIWNKKNEDLSMMEQLTFAKTMAEFVANSTEIASVMEKLNGIQDEEMFKNLNEEQIKAFESIAKILEKRMNEIDEKYKNVVVNNK